MSKPKVIKVKTRRMGAFQGDTWIGIDLHLENGWILPAFGVWPRTDRQGRYYESDNGGYFNTLTEAKNHALEAYNNSEGDPK